MTLQALPGYRATNRLVAPVHCTNGENLHTRYKAISSPSTTQQTKAEAIYKVAGELFAAQGYAATSIEQIAARVGIHKSTMFHYVRSKQDLLASVLERGLRDYLTRLTSIAANDQTSYRSRLEAAVANHLTFVFEQQVELTVFLHERRHLTGDRGREYIEMADHYEHLFRGLVAAGMEAGEFRPLDPALTTFVLLGASNWAVHWYSPKGRLSREEIIDNYRELLVNRLLVAGIST